MSILISIGLSKYMKEWLNEEPRNAEEIVEHISDCPYFKDRDRNPIKYVEVQLNDRRVCCVGNADGTILKEIPSGINAEDLVDWIGSYMLHDGDICEEANNYGDIFTF